MRRYASFCTEFGYTICPASDATLTRYAVFLADRLAYSSVVQYMNVIRIIHQENGYADPLKSFSLSNVLHGVRRALGDKVTKKAPLTPRMLVDILSTLNMEHIEDTAIWAAALVSFFCMLRRSNVTPQSASSFNAAKNLTRGDITVSASMLTIRIRWSKTIQFRERELIIPLPRCNTALSPYLAVVRHFALTPEAHALSPAFLRANSSKTPLTTKLFISRIKAALVAKGYDPSQYSGHSFRRGGASFAHQSGVPVQTIKHIGDWKSSAFEGYIVDNVDSMYAGNCAVFEKIVNMF